MDLDRCLGCGVCISNCPTESISLFKKTTEVRPSQPREDLYEIIMAEPPVPKFIVSKCLTVTIFFLFIVILAFSCAPKRQVIDAQLEGERFGYLQDGKTNRPEIIDRWGNPHHSYENGRIIIYSWFDEESGDYVAYDIVLICNENDILERHSVVRVR